MSNALLARQMEANALEIAFVFTGQKGKHPVSEQENHSHSIWGPAGMYFEE